MERVTVVDLAQSGRLIDLSIFLFYCLLWAWPGI